MQFFLITPSLQLLAFRFTNTNLRFHEKSSNVRGDVLKRELVIFVDILLIIIAGGFIIIIITIIIKPKYISDVITY